MRPPSPSPSDARPRWPLTGKLLKDKGKARHAAVAVKVPDNRREHLAAATLTRPTLSSLNSRATGRAGTAGLRLFRSSTPAWPTASRSAPIRPVDILLSPIHALIGNTGAAAWVVNYVKHYRAHLEGLLSYMNTRRSGSYGIDASRVYTLNGDNYYDKAVVSPSGDARPADQTVPFGAAAALLPLRLDPRRGQRHAGKRGRSIRIPYKGDSYFMGYDYDKETKRYLRSMPWGPHVLANGRRVSTDNVLVIKAKQHYGKIFRGGGHDEPLHDIIKARGKFYYFNRGRYVIGTWRKGKVQEPFEFTLKDGSPLKMAPGQTFVELPNVGAKLRIKARSDQDEVRSIRRARRV